MGALNTRDLGDERKAALAAEARARRLSVSELARRFIYEGIDRARARRERQAWAVARAPSAGKRRGRHPPDLLS